MPSNYQQSIKRNTVYSSSVYINGLDIMYAMFMNWNCTRISGFTVYKSTNFAILYRAYSSVLIDSNILIDNQVGIYSFVMNPLSNTHQIGNKISTIQNNLIIGQSSVYDCSEDNLLKPTKAVFINIGAGPLYNSKIGLIWTHMMDQYTALWSSGL